MTTPYEREILTHYYISLAPFPRADAPLFKMTIDKFIKLGLLERDGDEIKGVEGALRIYMDALAAVPLPVHPWIQPVARTGESAT